MRFLLIALIALLPQMAVAEGPNHPPVAVATADGDGTTLVDEPIRLWGTTDPEGDAVEEGWWAVEVSPTGSNYSFIERNTDQNPLFVADTAGVYQISLTASDLYRRGPTDTIEVVVADNQPPTAVITASTLSAVAPAWIDFSAALSSDPEHRQLVYVWEFTGLEAPSMLNGVEVSAFFPTAGTYDVQLFVADDRGLLDIAHIQVELTAPQTNTAPTLSVSASPLNGPAPLAVNFVATAVDAENDLLTYTWDFGDGDEYAGDSVEAHTYAANSSYTAWVTVSDGVHEVSESVTITVSEVPRISIKRVVIKFNKSPSDTATVQIDADTAWVEFNENDTIAVDLDGKRLFAAPFSSFILAADDEEDDPTDPEGLDGDLNDSLYKYRDPLNLVFLDVAKGRIRVFRKSINLSEFTPADGATIELTFGNVVLADTVPVKATNRRFHYTRKGNTP